MTISIQHPLLSRQARRAVLLALCLVTGGLLAGAASAENRTFTCPPSVSGALADIPDGWSAKDIETKLSRTRVIEDGRRDTLRCVYGDVTRIDRQGPRDANCRAVQDGFVCQLPDAPRSVREERRSIACPASLTGQPQDAPKGWTGLEVTRKLNTTRVVTTKSGDVLRCAYGQAGVLQATVPQGAVCDATDTGFDCVIRIEGPAIHASGTGTVEEDFAIDLDRSTGNVKTQENADLWLRPIGRFARLIAPINGASFSVGPAQRGYDGCKDASYTTDMLPLIMIPDTAFICFKTNKGRIGELQVQEVLRRPTTQITLTFTTWKKR